MKKITIGIPAYKATLTIDKLLSSILTQTISDNIAIIIANDFP